jgi:hypothetical protein
MENLWEIMVRQVYGKGKQYSTKQQLFRAVQKTWDSLSLKTI